MAFPKIEGYVVTEKLGSGSYSTVYKAYTKVGTRSVVAVKCVDKCRVRHSTAAVDSLVSEIRLLKTLLHPHIVTLINFTWDDKNIYIITEFCNGGDLSKYIRRYGRVPEQQVLYFLQQLASALKFLWEKGVAHMDLKPHNLLLHKDADAKYTLKVADFGLAQHLVAEGAGVRGSPLYMAPEVLLAAKYDARADLWSVGVIMYECLFGRAPFSGSTLPELVEKIQKKTPIEMPPGSGVSKGCRDLMSRLLTHEADSRITHDDFFNHDYLDLDHMPSKENYEKAVSLISQAITQESSGCLPEALSSYTSALRYLVPAVKAEPKAPRRHALRSKLERYMERAEEIKQYLDAPESPVNSAIAVTTKGCNCSTNSLINRTCSCASKTDPEIDKTNENPPNHSQNQNTQGNVKNTNINVKESSQEDAKGKNENVKDTNDHVKGKNDHVKTNDNVKGKNDHVKGTNDHVKGTNDNVKTTSDNVKDSGKDGSLKRRFKLFRRTTVPQLTAQDSSIITGEEATSEDTSDACRIT